MKCKDCVSYNACKHMWSCFEHINNFEEIYENFAERCDNFKDKSKWVGLPCAIGDTVYVVGTKCLSGDYDFECEMYDAEFDCPCHLDKEWIVFKREVDVDLLVNIMKNSNPNFIFGETVFCTRDEAEDKLEEIIEANGEVK